MYRNKKIIAVSPVGRQRTMKVLFKEILKHRYIVDEYHLWVNTEVPSDLEFIHTFAAQHKDFVKLNYGCEPLDPKQMGRAHNIRRFFNYCTESNTFYYRIDDDILFIENGVFEKLADYKFENPETLLTYPLIINNTWCTEFLRRAGSYEIPECKIHSTLWYEDFNQAKEKIKNDPDTMTKMSYELHVKKYMSESNFCSPLYWNNPIFAYNILTNALDSIKSNTFQNLFITNKILTNYEPVSINFIMWCGEDFAKFNGLVRSVDEEPWLTMFYPLKHNLYNAVVGNTRVIHYAYWPQRPYLDTTVIS